MTRKTRSQQLTRIHTAFQTGGYCENFNIIYNDIEEHLQTKKHLKLSGEDDFISIQSDPFYNINNPTVNVLDAKILNNYNSSSVISYKKMLRTRRTSLCDRTKDCTSNNDVGNHRLRSRKHINYMSPTSDEDNLNDKSDIVKEYRELRSSTRLLAKLTDRLAENDDVWNSGRPKRTCIKQKRISADQRLVVDNRSYYKVEVLPTKLRSSSNFTLKDGNLATKHLPIAATTNNHKNNNDCDIVNVEDADDDDDDDDDDGKGLIVKFRKLRNSELVQLNSEAENFLFPKKDESTTEDEEEEIVVDEEKIRKTKYNKIDANENSKNNNSTLTSDHAEESQLLKKFKDHDDECSMNSTSSESNSKAKKRRRTHAEAFIMDNQKYYKFETPGSRLRYQGSYLSPVPSIKLTPTNNTECCSNSSSSNINCNGVKTDKALNEKIDENTENLITKLPLNIDQYKFSFEEIPTNDFWYETFRRQDTGLEHYLTFSDDLIFNTFLLPYQIEYISPLNPQECINHYKELKKYIMESLKTVATSVGSGNTSDASTSNSILSSFDSVQDEDSKISATMTEVSSVSSTIDEMKVMAPKKRGGKQKNFNSISNDNGKNPRKSPRQHASTLAILSSLIHQRKKRKTPEKPSKMKSNLPVILEESFNNNNNNNTKKYIGSSNKLINKRRSNINSSFICNNTEIDTKRDYTEVMRVIDEEVGISYDDNYLDYLDKTNKLVDSDINKVDVISVLRRYEQNCAKEDSRGTRRFFNGAPGRKPGRKKKKNRTGWPNRNKRIFVRKDQMIQNKEDYLDDSTIDSLSVNADTDYETCEDVTTDNANIKKKLNVGKLINNSVVMVTDNTKPNNNLEHDIVINNCDLINSNLSSDRVKEHDYNITSSGDVGGVDNNLQKTNQTTSTEKVLTTKINNSAEQFNIDMQYQPYVRVQKLDSEQIDMKIAHSAPSIQQSHMPKGSDSPKRTNRSQRRMPASPKSPRMLRRPRGRWYRER